MIETLAPDLRRIVAPNPSPLTGAGTNTYLIGQGDLIVIDPGPAMPSHQAEILAALRPGERVSRILVTHTHLDHSGLAPALARATGAPAMGFGRFDAGRSERMRTLAAAGLPDGGEGIDRQFSPDIAVKDGDLIEGLSWSLRILHTPGHAATHVCLAMGNRLFTGDHVMGWSSSLISPPDGDMAAYMASLLRLQAAGSAIAHPAHGPDIADPAGRIAALIAHRRLRETALLDALKGAAMTLGDLTAAVYHDTPAHLHAAARRNVLAHVIDLVDRNLLTCADIDDTNPNIAPA